MLGRPYLTRQAELRRRRMVQLTSPRRPIVQQATRGPTQPGRCLMQLQVPWFKPAAWGVVVGAIGSMIIGFSWLGWTLGSRAERMSVERSNSAVVRALPPSGGARLMQPP